MPTKGIYRLYYENADSYIGFSHNIEGTLKRLKFELKLNACSYKPLQSFYNEHGDELRFEVLEEFSPQEGIAPLSAMTDDAEYDAHIRARLFKWKARLGGNVGLIQTPI